ncbi:hypothetical protein N8289_03630, partial [Flavobacteriales bacterium]|nr:hypothetical protein [Flavobacteriales bacterium]
MNKEIIMKNLISHALLLMVSVSIWSSGLSQCSGISLSAGSDTAICPNNTFTFNGIITGLGANQANYQWTGPDGFSDTTLTPAISSVSQSDAGTYVLSATIGNCVVYDTVVLGVYNLDITSNNFLNVARTQLVRCIGPSNDSGYIFISLVLPPNVSLVQTVVLDWGDGVLETVPPSSYSNAQAHKYKAGSYSLTVSVSFTSGCSSVLNYSVFVGSSPSPAALLLFQNQATGCLPHSTSFTFNVPSANVDGTTYEVDWGDGSPTVTYTHPNTPPVLNHVYGQSSCGNTIVLSGNTYNNIFSPKVTTLNPCSVQPQTSAAGLITVGVPPDASFSMNIDSALKEIELNNTSDFGLTIPTTNGANCDSTAPFYWRITPNNSTGAANWSIVSGSLGSNNGFPGNSGFWSVGTLSPRVKFLVSGTYVIDLFVGNDCGLSQYSDTVIISQGSTCYISEIFNESACSSYTWSQNGTTYVTSGFYYDTIINISGCDSLLILNLKINPQSSPASLALFVNQANGCLPHSTSFTFNVPSANVDGTTYVVDWGDGSPTVTYTHPITPPVLNHVYGQSSCGNTIVLSGNTYNNIFSPKVTTLNPCSVQPQTSAAGLITVGVPPDASFSMNIDSALKEIELNNTSDFGLTIPTTNGANCDSTAPFYWSITPDNSSGASNWNVVSGTLGSNNSFPGNAAFWSFGSMAPRIKFLVSGTYVIDLFVENDCGLSQYSDTVIISQGQTCYISETFNESACSSYTWSQNGTTYVTSGFYYDTIINNSGCDSILALNLTINNSTTGVDVQTACDSYTWINGVTYTSSNNTATDTLTNAQGCDSIVTLNLVVIKNSGSMAIGIPGTLTNQALPIEPYYGYSYSQSIFLASELNNSGIIGYKSLDTLIFEYRNSTLINSDAWTVYIGHTNKNSFNSVSDWEPLSSLTQVFSGTAQVTVVTGSNNLVKITLSTPFIWNGLDNIIIAVDENHPGYGQSSDDFYSRTTSTTRSLVFRDDLINPNPFSPPSAIYQRLAVPNLNIAFSSNTGVDFQTACDSFTWINGVTYTSSNNTAKDTLTSSTGCDSIVTLNLTINNSNTGVDFQTACDSYTWINGVTYTSSNNTAKDTLTSSTGCDSIVTLNLTINNSTTGVDVQIACDSFTWINGVTYTSSNNTATDTLTNSQGCDSVVTLNLTINNSTTGVDVQTACDSFYWNQTGISYNKSGVYRDTLMNIYGCDSILTLDLKVYNDSVNLVEGNATIGVSGTTVNQALPIEPYYGYSYSQSILLASELITSGITRNISLDTLIFEYRTSSLNNSDAWTVYIGHTNKNSFNSGSDWEPLSSLTQVFSGTATVTVVSGSNNLVKIPLSSPFVWNGLDNIIIAVDENSPNYGSSTADDFFCRSTSATRSLVYRNDYTNPNPASPPSASFQPNYVPNLKISYSNKIPIWNINDCNSYFWSQNGISYSSSGIYYDTLLNKNGCDSILTLNLTINNPTSGTDFQTACDSFTWINGVTYTSSNNTATDTLTNAQGCDSVVTLNLTINNSNTGVDVQTACGSYTWINGLTYTSSNNTATDTLTNAQGCDSVVTLNLTINNSNTGVDVQTACDSYTWINGLTYTSSNNSATDTLTNTHGCDSVVTLNLTINNSNIGTDTQTACNSYTWINGVTYTSSNNTATQTLTNAQGCDSVVTLNLTINNSNTGTDTQTACNSYTWINGVTYTSSNNTATQTLTNAQGCDSVVALNLTINNSTTGVDVQTSCDSYTWINGVTYTSSNNTATDTFTNSQGCDSIVTLNLTINPSAAITSQPVNQTVFVGGNAQFQLTASGTGLTYQWQQNNGTGFTDISSFGIYSGTTTNTLTITGVNASIQQNGYRCKISNSTGCSDTTDAAILYISLTGIDE